MILILSVVSVLTRKIGQYKRVSKMFSETETLGFRCSEGLKFGNFTLVLNTS